MWRKTESFRGKLQPGMTQCKRILALFCTFGMLAGCSLPWSTGDNEPLQGAEKESTVEYVPTSEAVIALPSVERELVERDEEVITNTVSWAESELGGYAVSSSSAEATWAGMYVLSQGGNAVDAAVAVSLTLGVTEPYSSGLGGGGFMLVYDSQTGEATCLDYYSCAGIAQNSDIGIPGLLMGMDEAVNRWGNLTLEDALEVAIYYAENGFVASESFISRLEYSSSLRNNPAFSDVEEGDLVVQSELAETLRSIQTNGIQEFYDGGIAQDIASASGLRVEDISGYAVNDYEAIETEAFGYRILTSSAPSSGLTVAQMLRLAEKMDIPSPEADVPGYLRVLDSATSLAYSSRLSNLADPQYCDMDTEYYLSDAYLDELLQSGVATSEVELEEYCTTQFSVIDGNGLMVCVTNTLSDNWGSGKCVDGFYLNDSLSNFSSVGVNTFQSGMRPRTYIAPTIVLGEDGFCFAIGSPGGNNIPRVIVPVILDVIRFGTDIQTAVEKARAFCDTDGAVCLESPEGRSLMVDNQKITRSYYYSSQHIYFGCTSVVGYDPDEGMISVCDRRRETAQAMLWKGES